MRIRRGKIFGPLYAAELARLSRRPSFMLLKVGLVLLLLFAFFVQYPQDEDTVSANQQAKFANQLLMAIGGVQLLAVWLLTPWFAASVLNEEREQKTLDLLLTTTLTDYDLVAGKLAARITFVAAVILAGFPVFAMLLVFGGVSLATILLIYAGTLLNLIAIGGLTSACTTMTSNFRQTLVMTWLMMIVAGFCPVFGPFWFMTVMGGGLQSWKQVLFFAVMNLGVGVVGLLMAVKSVRPWERAELQQRPRTRLPVAKDVREAQATQAKSTPERPVLQRNLASVPVTQPSNTPIGIKADLAWDLPSEASTGPSSLLVMTLLFVAALGIGLLIGLAYRESEEHTWMATMCMAWIPVAVGTCVSIAPTLTREREADTLMMLLTVPAGRTEILWRKVCLRLQVVIPLWIVTGLLGSVVILTTIDTWYWSLAYLTQGLAMLIAAVGFGVFLSVHSNTTFLAQAAAIMLMLFAGVMPQWSSFTLDDRFLRFLPIHAAFLVFAGYGGWHSAVRTFQRYCPK